MVAFIRRRGSGQEGFGALLSDRDRNRLRAIVKQVHLKHYPEDQITDYEADRVIDVMAPETIEALIRRYDNFGR